MELAKLQAEFAALQSDPAMDDETNLQGREKALDYIRFLGEIAELRGSDPVLTALYQQALVWRAHLEPINQKLFARLRTNIQAGEYTREALRQQLNQFTAYRQGNDPQPHLGYEGLDILIGGLFEIDPPPQATQALTAEMVHYEPTPARALLELIDRVNFRPNDIFYDIGSGLGQVTMLVHLLTGIQTKGIEFEPVFCTYAQSCARQLGFSQVEFINVDARMADYAEGDVFYLFTPFKGALLQTVLGKLEHVAQQRSIKVCTYGPCTPHVAKQPWLRPLDASANHEFKVAIFAST
jgi:hypothetical protein